MSSLVPQPSLSPALLPERERDIRDSSVVDGHGPLRGYKMGGILGTGAFAQVRKAWDPRGRRVAIKIISRGAVLDVSGVER